MIDAAQRPVLVIRPEPGLSATLARGRELGLRMVGAPSFMIEPIAWTPPDAAQFDVLLAGSANVFRHGGERLATLRSLPVYAVGSITAALAERAGFSVSRIGKGGLRSLVDANETGSCRFLRLGGEERVPLNLLPEHSLQDIIVYRAIPQRLEAETANILRKSTIVALHSAIAVQHFAAECTRLAVDRHRIVLAVLGPRIAEAAGTGWNRVRVAPEPNDAALLEMIASMCK